MLKTDLGPVGAQGTSVEPREEGHVRTEKEKNPGENEDLHGRMDMTDQGNHAKRRRERGQPESLAATAKDQPEPENKHEVGHGIPTGNAENAEVLNRQRGHKIAGRRHRKGLERHHRHLEISLRPGSTRRNRRRQSAPEKGGRHGCVPNQPEETETSRSQRRREIPELHRNWERERQTVRSQTATHQAQKRHGETTDDATKKRKTEKEDPKRPETGRRQGEEKAADGGGRGEGGRERRGESRERQRRATRRRGREKEGRKDYQPEPLTRSPVELKEQLSEDEDRLRMARAFSR